MPAVVDEGLLIQESGLFLFCPPFIPFNECKAYIGDVRLVQTQLRPSRSGDGFLCVVDSPVPDSDHCAFGIPDPAPIHGLFGDIAALLTQMVACTTQCIHQSADWISMVNALDQDLAEVQDEILSITSMVSFDCGLSACELSPDPDVRRHPVALVAPLTSPGPSSGSSLSEALPFSGSPSCVVPCPGPTVTLSLDAALPHARPFPAQPIRDHLSTLEWAQQPDWKQAVLDSLDLHLCSVPASLLLLSPASMAIFTSLDSVPGPLSVH